MARIILLSGVRGVGKTTACLRLATLARHESVRIGGIICPSHLDAEGERDGILAQDVATGEQRLLASLEADPSLCIVGRFRFQSDAMSWALNVVSAALCEPLDAVIMDEIGPLELQRGGGFAPALSQVVSARAACVLLVVRFELLELLRARLGTQSCETRQLTVGNRDCIAAELLEWARGDYARQGPCEPARPAHKTHTS